MSWSVNFIGYPENIVTALRAESENLTEDSKKEFDEVLPHLITLVQNNYSNNGVHRPVIKLIANGHKFNDNGKPVFGSCRLTIETVDGILV